MEFEVDVRIEGSLTAEQKEEFNHNRLTDPAFDEEEYLSQVKNYYYVPLTIDLREVCAYRLWDDDHTLIKTFAGEGHIAQIDYYEFQAIRSTVLGKTVKTAGDFKMQIEVEPEQPKRKK